MFRRICGPQEARLLTRRTTIKLFKPEIRPVLPIWQKVLVRMVMICHDFCHHERLLSDYRLLQYCLKDPNYIQMVTLRSHVSESFMAPVATNLRCSFSSVLSNKAESGTMPPNRFQKLVPLNSNNLESMFWIVLICVRLRFNHKFNLSTHSNTTATNPEMSLHKRDMILPAVPVWSRSATAPKGMHEPLPWKRVKQQQ